LGNGPCHRVDRRDDRSERPLGVGREEGQEISGPSIGQRREESA